MNYYGLLKHITSIAEQHPNVHTVILSDIYALNANKATEFNVFAITPKNFVENYEGGYRTYNLVLYMIDRLGEDGECEMKQSYCVEELSNIIKGVQDTSEITVDKDVVYVPFTESFQQLCCGVYAEVAFTVPLIDCFEELD